MSLIEANKDGDGVDTAISTVLPMEIDDDEDNLAMPAMVEAVHGESTWLHVCSGTQKLFSTLINRSLYYMVPIIVVIYASFDKCQP